MSLFFELNNILVWKIPNQDDYNLFVGYLCAKYARLQSVVYDEFGEDGWYILALFAFFLLLIIIIYIKSIAVTFRAGKEEIEDPDTEPDGLFYTIEDNHAQNIANDNTEGGGPAPSGRFEEEDLDRELSLSLLEASKSTATDEDRSRLDEDVKRRMKIHADAGNAQIKELQHYLENMQSPEAKTAGAAPGGEIICMIINLLGRGVTTAKISQSLYNGYKDMLSAHDVIRTVQSVCNFIGLCNAGKFDNLPQKRMLPENDAALYAWANGDCSLVLILLQAFLNELTDEAETETGTVKDMTCALASNCACIIGDVSVFNDLELAHNSFALATELSSKNVAAWNRLGDVYMRENSPEKAVFCYQNVIDIADTYLYASELAHAEEQLASYYRRQEVTAKADSLEKQSSAYYAETGIKFPLTEKEVLAYNMIYTSIYDNLQKYIYALLDSYNF